MMTPQKKHIFSKLQHPPDVFWMEVLKRTFFSEYSLLIVSKISELFKSNAINDIAITEQTLFYDDTFPKV